MALNKINVGTAPNKGDGDTLRDAFIKVNENYDNIYDKNEVDTKIAGVEVDLSNYDTKAEVDTKIDNALDSLTIPTKTSELENDGDGTSPFVTVDRIFGSGGDIYLSSDKGGSISIEDTIIFNDSYAFPTTSPRPGDFLVTGWPGELQWKQQSLIEKDGGFYLNYNDGRLFDPGFGSTNLSYQNTTDFSGDYSFAAGNNADAQAKYGVAIGNGAKTDYSYENSFAIGVDILCEANNSIAIGEQSYIVNSSNSYSFGMGLATTSLKDNLMVLGRWNSSIVSNDSFVVGIGEDDDNRKNGLVIKTNGLIQAPEAKLVDINASTPNTLVTKEYVDSVSGGGSLGSIKAVQRGANIGYQMSTNPNEIRVTHNSITLGLISNLAASNRYMGNSAMSQGSGRTIASGHSSFAGGMNSETLPEASASISYGSYTIARTSYSQAFGERTEAYGPNQMVIGRWNIFDFTSKFVIGNGTANNARKNIFWVTEDGTTYSQGNIESASGKALVTKEYVLNPGTFINLLTAATPEQITEIKTLLGII